MQRKMVQELAELIENKYVYADVAKRVADSLRNDLAAGTFDEAKTAPELASMLSEYLHEYDLHFNVKWQPPREDAASESGETGNEEPWQAKARRDNYGFSEVRRLAGNIGYLDLRCFEEPECAGDTAAAAMRFIADSDAVIVDLRNNDGGSPEMVQLICSYFFGPEPVHLNSLYWREGDTTSQFWTLPHVPGKRMPDVPLDVLTSAGTASGAEEFAYDMQTSKRGVILGETTLGAANPGDYIEMSDGFRVFISTGATVNPITKTNWEGTGVTPDVDIAASAAFDAAYLRALNEVRGRATSEGWKREIDWAIEAAEVGQNPIGTASSLGSNRLTGCERTVPGTYITERAIRRHLQRDRWDG